MPAGINSFDIALVKSFTVYEGLKAQLRGGFFNAWNRTEFGVPGTSQGTAQLGVISGVSYDATRRGRYRVALKLILSWCDPGKFEPSNDMRCHSLLSMPNRLAAEGE